MSKEQGSIASISLCVALSVLGCNSGSTAGPEEMFELPGGQIAFQGKTDESTLSRDELTTYIADREYVRGLADPGVAINLNHADPRQHRFAVARMMLAGKTPESAPELFRQMEELKAAHLAQGLVPGAPAPAPASASSLAATTVSQHKVLTTGVTTSSQTALSGALVSRKETLAYGYADNCLWTQSGSSLGPCSFQEVFGNMRYSVPQTSASLVPANGAPVVGDSFMTVTLAGTNTVQQSYVAAAPQTITAADSLNLPVVEHPRDMDGNGFAVVCLDRTWTNDCEYNNTGMLTLKIPLKGSISLKNPDPNNPDLVIDWNKILTDYRVDAGPSPKGNILATLGTSGGGCELPKTGQSISTMRKFWDQVTVSPAVNPTTMHWDLYTNSAFWADFSSACRLVQDTVYVTMMIPVPYLIPANGSKGTFPPVTITNADTGRPLTPPNLQFRPPIRVTNSCLAEGTRIAVGGADSRKIEDLHIGDKVSNPYASSLTITDTALGTERSPMVRIGDTHGRELLMTETHPLYIVGRGMVAAKHLKIGDLVKTDDGASQLIRVSREEYTGKVFNLKVGTRDEMRSLGEDQTTVYANGFLVGDGQIQDKYEAIEMHANDAATRKSLPMRWRQDYLTSKQNAARQQ